jgi:D-alanine-D-alanine ligase
MDKIRVGIVHNIPPSHESAYSKSSEDIMSQVEAIEYALKRLGHETCRIPFTRDLGSVITSLREEHPDMVFNMCETVDDNPAYAAHPAAIFELLDLPFSGSPSTALMTTTDKVMTKRILRGKGVRTPNYLIYGGSGHFNPACLQFPVIVKPRYEDASIGIDQDSVFETEKDLKEGLKRFYDRFGSILVEEFIDGREFNVSLFGYQEARIMPIAEIDFSKYPEELYPIVGYKAKWDEKSFEYHNSRRVFSPAMPQSLLWDIERIALECFHLFMLRDYGRIDMRVNRSGKVYVLEVNANPCLSPDAGFPAALEQAGITFKNMVQSFINFMTQRCSYDDKALRSAGQK